MNLDDLKLSEALQLMQQLETFKQNLTGTNAPVNHEQPSMVWVGKYVVVRTYAAGVHVGVLKHYDYVTRHAFLTESRRIWSWEGAFTLSAVATDGITGGKVAMALAEIMITQVEEIIPCTALSEKILRGKEVYKP